MLEEIGVNNMKKLLVCILFVLFGKQVFAQNFNKGLDAYIAGEYTVAIKEWMEKTVLRSGISQKQLKNAF